MARRFDVVDPDHTEVPIPSSPDVKLTAIVPPAWPPACSHDPNECSIALRIDFCSSSVLFTGDAEHDEEAALDLHGPVTLLQVAHHGSETSTTPGFLMKRDSRRYAVISAGKPGQGKNADYCHPRAIIVKRLTTLTGGPGSKTLQAFDGVRCSGLERLRLDRRTDERSALGDRARWRRGAHDERRRDVREGVRVASRESPDLSRANAAPPEAICASTSADHTC